MKRIISVLICLSIIGSIASCSKKTTITKSGDDSTANTSSAEDTNETLSLDQMSALGDIEVDEDLLTVTITIPADLAGEDASQEKADEVVAENGYISGTYNSDGSISYTMTKTQHKKIMNELKENIDKSLQEIIDSGSYPNILEIMHNDDYTDFKIKYSGEEVGFADSLTVIVFYYAGGMYGVFNGARPDNIHVSFVNADTGEVIKEANSKDAGTSETN